MKFIFITTFLIFSACASNSAFYTEDEKPEIYNVATRQLAPEPIYHPVRWVRPPQMMPKRGIATNRAPLILPIIHFNVKDTTIEQAALVLAGSARYKSFVASSIAEKTISLEMLGNIQEIADEISIREGIKVRVDHISKSVRFLSYY